jgi:hypothetical protein
VNKSVKDYRRSRSRGHRKASQPTLSDSGLLKLQKFKQGEKLERFFWTAAAAAPYSRRFEPAIIMWTLENVPLSKLFLSLLRGWYSFEWRLLMAEYLLEEKVHKAVKQTVGFMMAGNW